MEQKLKKLEESLERGEDEVISESDLQRELDKKTNRVKRQKRKRKKKIDKIKWQKKKE